MSVGKGQYLTLPFFVFSCQKNDEKLSLHCSSSGVQFCFVSCKSEFSENTDLPIVSYQSAHGKDEERTCEAILVEDDRTMEKGRH